MTDPWLLGAAAAASVISMTLVWLLSLALRNAGIVDVFWGLGFTILVVLSAWLGSGDAGRSALTLALVAVWGVRLAAHIGWRSRGKPEDFRYQEFRRNAGQAFWWRSYFTVFLLQGGVMWVVALPLLAALGASHPPVFGVWDVVAVVLWVVGFAFEAGGDLQLARFKANPANRGRVLSSGFWGLTRHPNYFGDALVWWGFGCLGLAVGAWWALIGPVVMTFLLWRVSGVAMLERSMVDTKPGYREYVESTPAFLPRIPGLRRRG